MKEKIYDNTLFTSLAITSTNKIIDTVTRKHYNRPKSFQLEREAAITKRVQDINNCRQEGNIGKSLVYDKESQKLVAVFKRCNSRMCNNCNERKKVEYRKRLYKLVRSFQTPKLLTLSFKSTKQLKRQQLKDLSKQFMRFREYVLRKENTFTRKKYSFNAYVAVMEIKYNKKGDSITDRDTRKKIIGYHKENNWNIHYHMVYDGDYIPVYMAREIFKQVTKDKSFYVHIKSFGKVARKDLALKYVTKYISKMHFNCEELSTMLEYYDATYKIRFLKVYGINYKIDKNERLRLYNLLKKDKISYEEFLYFVLGYQSQYMTWYQYVKSKEVKLEHYELQMIESEIIDKTEKYDLKSWDIEKDEEENVFNKYISDEVLDKLGKI